MKKHLTPLLLLLIAVSANAQLSWLHKGNFTGQARFKTVGFALNGKGYIVGGRVDTSPLTYVKDVWEYEPSTDTWTQKNNFTYTLVQPAFFTIGSKAYIVGGQNGSITYVNTTSEYDPTTDSWTSKASFPESGVGGTFQFVINGKAYVGTGARLSANKSNTVYEYDAAGNNWTSKANFPGASRVNATGFAIGNFGYAGLGTDGSGNLYNDFYKYNPTNNTWTPIAQFPGKARLEAVCFVIDGKAYVGGGARLIGSTYFSLNDFYEYDPATDTWAPAPGIPGLPRAHSGFFTINDRGYLVGGYEYEDDVYYNLVDKFAACGNITNMEEVGGNENHLKVNLFPNPTADMMNVSMDEVAAKEITYEVVSVDGKLLLSEKTNGTFFNFSTRNFSKGFYVLVIKDGEGNISANRFEVIK